MSTPTAAADPRHVRVYVDGSSLDQHCGYGLAADDGRVAVGHLPDGTNAEIAAATVALTLFPPTVPLTIVTDNTAVIHGLGERREFRRTGTGTAQQMAQAVHLADARSAPVLVEAVDQGADHGAHRHAMAHFLAYLGRTETHLDPVALGQALALIYEADDPDAEAHALVRAILFPAGEDTHRVEATQRASGGAALSTKVEHYIEACSRHGLALHALHKIGVRDGVQRYRHRCLICHTRYNTEQRTASPAGA